MHDAYIAGRSDNNIKCVVHDDLGRKTKQEALLMLTTGSTRLAVSRGQQTWYHFGSIATFR